MMGQHHSLRTNGTGRSLRIFGMSGQAALEYLLATLAFMVIFIGLYVILHNNLTKIFFRAAMAVILPKSLD